MASDVTGGDGGAACSTRTTGARSVLALSSSVTGAGGGAASVVRGADEIVSGAASCVVTSAGGCAGEEASCTTSATGGASSVVLITGATFSFTGSLSRTTRERERWDCSRNRSRIARASR